MATDYTMAIHEDEDLDVYEEEDDHHLPPHHHPLSMSRLSVCTNSTSKLSICSDNEEDDGDDDMSMFMSRLSIECSDGDADEELSDDDYDDKEHMKRGAVLVSAGESLESEKDLIGCLSLPGTPTGGRVRGSSVEDHQSSSENESLQMMRWAQRDRARRRRTRGRWLDKKKHEDEEEATEHNSNSPSTVESDCFLITRPNGGRRSLCMDLEEVRACRDLGFQLEHERISMLEIPPSRLDTSSGGNSPISNWKISSPGDDPRDIKARLKVWAQAVALASASQLC